MVKRGRRGRHSRRQSRRQRGGEFTGRSMSGGEFTGRAMSGGEFTGRSMSGGEFSGRAMSGGHSPYPLSPAAYNTEGAPIAPSQYYTQSAGHRRRKSRRSKKGGNGVIATAAVPFGLLALQRYFKGSKTSKRGVAKMGRSFKRTFRRHRGGGGALEPLSPSNL